MLSLVAMYMIHSATGWVLVVCIPIFWGIMKVFSKIAYRDKIPSFLIGAFVGLPVVGAVVSHAAEFTYLIGKDPTMSGRTAIWNAVIGAAMKRPILGCGYMSFFHGAQGENANLVISGSWNVSASHNGFLDMLVTLGAIGLALLLYSLFRAFKNGLLCLGGGATPYLSWCFCMIFLFVVVNMDEKAMMLPDDLIWVLYVIACVGLAEGAKGTRGRLARTDIEAFKSADMSVAD
jgi:O-antigen ligase